MDYRSIIESRYNRQNWQELLHDIFRQRVEFWQHPQSVPVDESMAKGALYTGKITLPDGHIIAIYEVELSDSIVIERNRAGIRNLLCASWRGMGCSGAFMFCFRQNEAILRFSYVSEPFVFAEDGSITKESTDTKRFTYLLGEGHRSRTAIKQFEYLKNSALDLKSITKAFSVEALSDEFFKEYKKHYEDIIEYITGKRMVKVANKWEEQVIGQPCSLIMQEFSHFTNAEKAVRDYVKKLMGRLVFIQFLQKKGWMGCSAGESWNDGDKEFVQNLFENTTCKDTFVDDVLEPLFNDINTKRKDDISSSKNVGNGIKIPYLNGGLFERDDYDKTNFPLPAKYMKNLLDFFASYNFTIDENDPDDAEIGVDPEMLGRIFENLLEDNKDKGAFYTPKEIVQYMCRESLIAYLQTDVNDEQTKDDIRQFVTTYNASVLSDDLKEIVDQKLKDVRICDPAIGSGAFPMGLLRELYVCRKAIEGIDDESAVSIKTHIIQSNIYGVDIEKGAVDIARLRFWLSLIVDERTPHALPNMDFKIMQGNSLLEQYKGVDLSDIMKSKVVAHDNSQLSFFDDEVDIIRRNVAKLRTEYFSTTDHKKRAEIRNKINDLVQKQIEKDINRGVADLSAIDIAANDQFFLWHTWFSEVFEENGGFDIVIGNPPYIQIKKLSIKDRYKAIGYESYDSTGDLYCLFYEFATKILCDKGTASLITSNKWLKSNYGESLRNYLILNSSPKYILDLGPGVFENAAVDTNILICSKEKYIGETNVAILHDTTNIVGVDWQSFELTLNDMWNIDSIQLIPIKNKIETIKHRFNSLGYELDYGILTGANKTFIISGDQAKELIALDEHNKEIIKPLLRGQDLGRYSATFKDFYLLCTHNGVKKENIPPIDIENDYPTLIPYFESFGCNFKNRGEQGDTHYNLRNCAYIHKYESPKIIYADIVQDQGKFYYDEEKYYTNDTAFLITGPHLKYMVGLLNSIAFSFFYKSFYCGSSLGKSGLRFKRDFLLRVPIPMGSAKARESVESLVEQILSAKKLDPHADTTILESEIDRLVYDLYGLTEDEIRIVEGTVNQ